MRGHSVHFSKTSYIAAHGRQPSGRGRWAFRFSDGKERFAPSGSLFSEAKKWATQIERERCPYYSISIVEVLS